MKTQLVKEFVCHSLSEFQASAKEIVQGLPSRLVIALSGPMGAGKTSFVQGLYSEGHSPTFAIHQRYRGVDHLDLYRLEDESELESTGFWDLFSQEQGLVFIEWPEKMDLQQIPLSWDLWVIEIQILNATERKIRWFKRL